MHKDIKLNRRNIYSIYIGVFETKTPIIMARRHKLEHFTPQYVIVGLHCIRPLMIDKTAEDKLMMYYLSVCLHSVSLSSLHLPPR